MSVCLYTTSIYIYIPGTQLTLALIGKGLLLKGATPKTKDKQVPGIYIYTPYILSSYNHIILGFQSFIFCSVSGEHIHP